MITNETRSHREYILSFLNTLDRNTLETIAKSWAGNGGVNYAVTTRESLILLIADSMGIDDEDEDTEEVLLKESTECGNEGVFTNKDMQDLHKALDLLANFCSHRAIVNISTWPPTNEDIEKINKMNEAIIARTFSFITKLMRVKKILPAPLAE